MASYHTIEEQEAVLGQAEALLASYNKLLECQQEATILRVHQDSYNRDKWVLGIDTREVVELIEKMVVLMLLKEDIEAYKVKATDLKDNRKILKIDATILRKEVATLIELRQLAKDESNVHMGYLDLDQDKEKVDMDLKAAKDKLDKAILAGPNCPVCNSPLKGDHNHILSNIARLVGAK